ncbi:MAG: coenzyme F430 synthase [Methanoregula sp.]|nr:coenzyme F430 synthase [Methanoregula sp.]
MNVLVLDTIHGADVIGKEFAARGDCVDTVDVYRNGSAVTVADALARSYDLVVAPVHLDPDHSLLQSRHVPVVSHHEAVGMLLKNRVPQPMVEITGARGKTTTAFALAHIMPGKGILLTSAGTYQYPGRELLTTTSITPASVLAAAKKAQEINGWLVAEESLGVSGAGTLAIVTSAEDYTCAAHKKSALQVKLASLQRCQNVLLAPPLAATASSMIELGSIARCQGTTCHLESGGKSQEFTNPLLGLDAYRIPLMLAGAAGVLLGIDIGRFSTFQPIAGRLSVERVGNVVIVDNANSGTNLATTLNAAHYARTITGLRDLTLVIGVQDKDGAVCEGFPDGEVIRAIQAISPQHVVLVGDVLSNDAALHGTALVNPVRSPSLVQGRESALGLTDHGSIVLAVKTWR